MAHSVEKAYEIMQGLQKLFSIMKPKHYIKEISPAQIMVMMSIHFMSLENGYTSPSCICRELGMSKSALTPILNKLEESEYIERKLSGNDRRKFDLTLTPKANLVLEAYQKNMQITVLNLIEHLGDEQTEEFLRLINLANDFYSKANERK